MAVNKFMWQALLVVMLVFTSLLAQLSAQQTVLFRERFETPGAAGQYGFPYKYPENGHWTVEHLPTGGYDGRGAAKITMRAGHTQYSFGWAMTTLANNHTFQMGDGFYLRFRIKFDEAMRSNEAWGNKFVMMGVPGTSPNSRFILYMSPPSGSSGCTLGMRPPNDGPWAYPGYYGISGFTSFSTSPLLQDSWSVAPKVNIGWDCAPPIYFTRPSNSRNATPGANSARPSNGWYHVQIYVQSGHAGQGAFKTWANNNNFAAPTTQKIGLTEGLGVQDWNRGATIGGYMDTATPSVNLGYVIDDVELGLTFDPTWFPGGVAPTPVNCTVSPWALTNTEPWGACVNNTQTRAEFWTRSIVTPASNGGTCTDPLNETRQGTQACVSPPPPDITRLDCSTVTVVKQPNGTWALQGVCSGR